MARERGTVSADPLSLPEHKSPLASVQETMRILDTSEYKVRAMVASKQLEGVRLGERGLKIKRASIEALLSSSAA